MRTYRVTVTAAKTDAEFIPQRQLTGDEPFLTLTRTPSSGWLYVQYVCAKNVDEAVDRAEQQLCHLSRPVWTVIQERRVARIAAIYS